MARSEAPMKSSDVALNRMTGEFKAYGPDGSVLWEKKEFTQGVDLVPAGVSVCMVASTLTDAKGEVRRWDPWKNGRPQIRI